MAATPLPADREKIESGAMERKEEQDCVSGADRRREKDRGEGEREKKIEEEVEEIVER